VTADAFIIQRFDETGIDQGDGVAAGFQQRGGFPGDADHGAQGNEGYIPSRLKYFRLADGEDFRLGGDRGSGSASPGVADNGGAVLVMVHGSEHVDEFGFILGLHEDNVRDTANHGNVKQPVVCGAVVRGKPGAVHAETHGQFLQRGVMLNHVNTALHESGVNGDVGFHALRRQPAGEEGAVLFRDPYVEIAFGEGFLE